MEDMIEKHGGLLELARVDRSGSEVIGEEETGCFGGVGALIEDSDYLKHELEHFGRGGKYVSPSYFGC